MMDNEEIINLDDDTSNNESDSISNETFTESNISYTEIQPIAVEDIDIYQNAFIGFGLAGSACLMCIGMIAIMNLFRRVV